MIRSLVVVLIKLVSDDVNMIKIRTFHVMKIKIGTKTATEIATDPSVIDVCVEFTS